jgi:hypothetical protein
VNGSDPRQDEEHARNQFAPPAHRGTLRNQTSPALLLPILGRALPQLSSSLASQRVQRNVHRSNGRKEQTMRKLTASFLATAALASGIFGGTALAASAVPKAHGEHAASLDSRSTTQRQSTTDWSRHDGSTREPNSPARDLARANDR